MSKTLKVSELVARLKEMPEDSRVEFESPGNYSVNGRAHRWGVSGLKEANYSDDGKYVVLTSD